MKKAVKQITLTYYCVYTATILTTVIGYLLNLNTQTYTDPKNPVNIAISSILILYIIISIPLALGIFFKMNRKWKTIEDKALKIEKYETGAIWRLIVIGIGLVGSVIAFYILRSESMIFCAGIAAIALLFCRPNEGKISADLELDEKED